MFQELFLKIFKGIWVALPSLKNASKRKSRSLQQWHILTFSRTRLLLAGLGRKSFTKAEITPFHKVTIKALWSQSTGPYQAWPGCGLSPYILLYFTSKQTMHFSYIQASCASWKEKTRALNLVLRFMYFWDAVLQIYLVAMMPYQIYSKFNSNFQILSAEKSWADTA